MPNIILVEKTGVFRSVNVSSYVEADLFKKAGFKTPDGFYEHAKWPVELNGRKYDIRLFGKSKGRSNTVNQFEFPPPMDNTQFFGNCVVLNKTDSGELGSLSVVELQDIYTLLYGGFEDLGEEDTSDEEEHSEEMEGEKTYDGYVKDGFVVSDEEEPEPVKPKKKRGKVEVVAEEEPTSVFRCTDELEEEAYV